MSKVSVNGGTYNVTEVSGMPKEQGLYLTRCYESNFEWEFVAVILGVSGLVVCDESLGQTPLDRYHEGLTDIEWCLA